MKARTTSEELVTQYIENTLKQNHIRYMVQGFEAASNMYLSYIEDGHNFEELKSFIRKSIENQKTIEEVSNKPNNEKLINIENELKGEN